MSLSTDHHDDLPPALPALDRAIGVTLFTDHGASSKRLDTVSLRGIVERIKTTRAPTKGDLPWLKLATFGNNRTPRGSYRHDANVVAIDGIEADYDGEAITLDRARQVVAGANIAAILYTSPSHTPDKPRWRILCPTSRSLPPERRDSLVARVNGLFVGALARESFTLSQAYYYGAVTGAEHHRVITVEGRFLDQASDLDDHAIQRPSKPAPTTTAPVAAKPIARDFEGGTAYGRAGLERECNAIRQAPEGEKHHSLNRAAYSIGGLVAIGEVDEATAMAHLRGALGDIRDRCADFDAAERTLADAFAAGMAKPRTKPEPREVRHTVRIELVPPEPPPRDTPPDYWQGEPVMEPDIAPRQIDAEQPQPKSALWLDPGAWEEEAIPRRPWLAPGYLMRGAVSALSGQGSGGKSSLVVCWSIALATGEEIGEFRPCGPLKVVNYNVEDDQFEQRRRYSAALAIAEKAPADIADRVIRCGPASIGTLFERHPDTGRIAPTPAMDALEALLLETEADVLICDPLAELHNAEENDNTAMRSVIAAFRAMAQRLGIAVLILHHDRKGTSAPGDMDRMRGASAITGAVRVMVTLTPMSPEEADKFGIEPQHRRRHFRIDGAKSNYALAQEAEWWKLQGVALANGEEVAACRPWSPPSTFSGLSHAQCVAVLAKMAQGRDGFLYAAKKQAGEDWAGALLMDADIGLSEGQASAVLNAWVASKVVTVGPHASPNSKHKRQAYQVDQEAFAEMRRQSWGAEA